MTFRNMATLQEWLAEFVELHYPIPGDVRVIEQDGTDGSHTGLVRVVLANAPTGAYIEPVSIGDPRWVVTMEARDEPITLTAPDVMNLATELTAISALCAFLQAKSTERMRDDQA